MPEQQQRKIYVLDTNVLVHDPQALSHFDEHDVVLPIVVLEEMDRVKRGFGETARNVREAARTLDELSEGCTDLTAGCPLPGGGRLFFGLNARDKSSYPEVLGEGDGDNRIIAVTLSWRREHQDRTVVLVSKDINMRVKARALGIVAEDYRSDRVVEDIDILPTGFVRVEQDDWARISGDVKAEGGAGGGRITLRWPPDLPALHVNQFVLLAGRDQRMLRCVRADRDGTVELHESHSFFSKRNAVWGVQARNAGQSMAMSLLMDDQLDLVTLLGQAGTGKTLLALACGLHQCLDLNAYDRMIVTRATVPMGQDIGFLPGTEQEKLEPWMGAVKDNLALLLGDDFKGMTALGQFNIEVTALSFTRGRTFARTWMIVDESQNLSPHQMKTIITRMGEGSKIVILGNNAQIDTPYLTAHTNGLSMAVMQFMNWPHAGHVTLTESERSRLSAYAVEVL